MPAQTIHSAEDSDADKCVGIAVKLSSMLLFFWLFTFVINLWHRKFVTAMFVNNQYGIQRRGQDFFKKIVFEGIHSKEVYRRIS